MNIENALKIDGWMAEIELEFLAETASKSELIVEFGCYKGRSTRALADNTPGIVYAVDPWGEYLLAKDGINQLPEGEDIFAYFRENLKDHIKSGKVIPVKDYSRNFTLYQKPNFIFIDGDHTYEVVKDDILKSLKMLSPYGILAGHDYIFDTWPGVKQAVDEIFGNNFRLIYSIWIVENGF